MRKKRALASRQSVWTVSDDDGSATTAGGKLPITVNGLASPTTIEILNPSAVHVSMSKICVDLVRTTYSLSYFRNELIKFLDRILVYTATVIPSWTTASIHRTAAIVCLAPLASIQTLQFTPVAESGGKRDPRRGRRK